MDTDLNNARSEGVATQLGDEVTGIHVVRRRVPGSPIAATSVTRTSRSARVALTIGAVLVISLVLAPSSSAQDPSVQIVDATTTLSIGSGASATAIAVFAPAAGPASIQLLGVHANEFTLTVGDGKSPAMACTDPAGSTTCTLAAPPSGIPVPLTVNAPSTDASATAALVITAADGSVASRDIDIKAGPPAPAGTPPTVVEYRITDNRLDVTDDLGFAVAAPTPVLGTQPTHTGSLIVQPTSAPCPAESASPSASGASPTITTTTTNTIATSSTTTTTTSTVVPAGASTSTRVRLCATGLNEAGDYKYVIDPDGKDGVAAVTITVHRSLSVAACLWRIALGLLIVALLLGILDVFLPNAQRRADAADKLNRLRAAYERLGPARQQAQADDPLHPPPLPGFEATALMTVFGPIADGTDKTTDVKDLDSAVVAVQSVAVAFEDLGAAYARLKATAGPNSLLPADAVLLISVRLALANTVIGATKPEDLVAYATTITAAAHNATAGAALVDFANSFKGAVPTGPANASRVKFDAAIGALRDLNVQTAAANDAATSPIRVQLDQVFTDVSTPVVVPNVGMQPAMLAANVSGWVEGYLASLFAELADKLGALQILGDAPGKAAGRVRRHWDAFWRWLGRPVVLRWIYRGGAAAVTTAAGLSQLYYKAAAWGTPADRLAAVVWAATGTAVIELTRLVVVNQAAPKT